MVLGIFDPPNLQTGWELNILRKKKIYQQYFQLLHIHLET